MEPTRSSALHTGCNPISVNCVMWDGSDLCCITVCRSDSVKDVIFQLSKMLCRHETQLNMSSLDLKCLRSCATGNCEYDLLDVLQLIIDKLAECCCGKGATGTPSPNPRTITYTVPASMRYVDDNGDTIDTLDEPEYLELTGQTAGVLVDRANSTDVELSSQNTRITELENNPPPTYTPPTVEAPFIMGDSNQYQMPVVIQATDDYADNLNQVLGNNSDILTAVGRQGSVGTAAAFSINGIVSSLPNWIASPSDMADALNNLWIYVQDLRFGVNQVVERTEPSCDQVVMEFVPTIVNNGKTAYLYFQGYSKLPAGFTDDPEGSGSLTISGTNYSNITSPGTIIGFSLEDAMTIPYIEVDLEALGLTAYPFFTFSATANLVNGSLSCQKRELRTIQSGFVACPVVSLKATATTVDYIFPVTAKANTTYIIDILNAAGTSIIDTDTAVNPTADAISGQFTSLTTGTTYNVRVTVNIAAQPSVVCTLNPITTP